MLARSVQEATLVVHRLGVETHCQVAFPHRFPRPPPHPTSATLVKRVASRERLRNPTEIDFRKLQWRNARAGISGGRMFTGVKVFSATKAKERDDLGEQVTRWLRANADLEIVDRTVMQSSDNEFHCLTVVIFYKPRSKP
jgi:hypothetical protein